MIQSLTINYFISWPLKMTHRFNRMSKMCFTFTWYQFSLLLLINLNSVCINFHLSCCMLIRSFWYRWKCEGWVVKTRTLSISSLWLSLVFQEKQKASQRSDQGLTCQPLSGNMDWVKTRGIKISLPIDQGSFCVVLALNGDCDCLKLILHMVLCSLYHGRFLQ